MELIKQIIIECMIGYFREEWVWKNVYDWGWRAYYSCEATWYPFELEGGNRCSCLICKCIPLRIEDEVMYHLYHSRFKPNYLIWIYYGVKSPTFELGASCSYIAGLGIMKSLSWCKTWFVMLSEWMYHLMSLNMIMLMNF